jgi:hypothetical protein
MQEFEPPEIYCKILGIKEGEESFLVSQALDLACEVWERLQIPYNFSNSHTL